MCDVHGRKYLVCMREGHITHMHMAQIRISQLDQLMMEHPLLLDSEHTVPLQNKEKT